MAFTTITPTALADPIGGTIGHGAILNVTAGVGNGVKFLNNGRIALVVINKGAAGSLTVKSGLFRGLAVADHAAITVLINTDNDGVNLVGPFDPVLYNDATGYCNVEITSGIGGMDCVAYALPG